jgi:CDP-diacylglycerol pyrophosphatase
MAGLYSVGLSKKGVFIERRRFQVMIFCRGNTGSQEVRRVFTMRLAFAAFALANACFLRSISTAQTKSTPDGGTEAGYIAETCPHASNPNALLELAEKCSKSLTSDANCRIYSNFKKDRETVESYIILKDCAHSKPFGYLLIPTETVVGVESSKIFSPSLVDLWSDAWLWSKRFPARPFSQTGLAINSNLPGARSQNQFHIHISCASSEVSRTLEQRKEISFDQTQAVLLSLGAKGHQYYAVKVRSLSGSNSPFNVAKTVLKPPANNLSGHGVAVIGSSNRDEYYVLVSGSESGNPGNAEELLDEGCQNEN